MPLSPVAPELPLRIFSPIARDYDTPALVLSLFRYRAWHRFLLSRLHLTSGARVLDMATGTGAIALDLLQRPGVEVVGGDATRAMLRQAQQRANRSDVDLDLVECTAEAPPFVAGAFDAITFGYLLRYVHDVPGTLGALSRLLKPGGVMASLDFAVPRGVWHPLWQLYTAAVLPAGGRLFSRDWQRVGAFLGPNIREFYSRWPEGALLSAWHDAGFRDVKVRRLTLGGAIAIWGTRV
jgi:demethylmenaquinone methyltransferase/2-methoxy-6-polyprenyl-1,4-benzoquinol methylase